MGCCFSSSKKRHRSPPPRNGGAPPQPPPLDVETVKEVLSETPIIPKPHLQEPQVLVNDKEADFIPQVRIQESTAVIKPSVEPTIVIKPEVSEETSELCSFTESYSTTATAAEKREEDGEVTQRSPIRVYKKRQNSGDGVRERSFRSQPGRSAPSPEKRRSPARRVQGRGMTAQRSNVGPPNGARRGPGENGVRRSQSPATRAPVEARKNMRYRSPAAREEKKQLKEEASPPRNVEEKPKEEVSPESGDGESLENPLVSLECFIFL